MKDLVKNIQVKGKYTAELHDPVTGKVKEHVQAENYINPLLWISGKLTRKNVQILPSSSVRPIVDGRDLFIDNAVLGISNIFDTSPAGTGQANPGTFMPQDSIIQGMDTKYTFMFAPNQAIGTINSIYTGLSTAATAVSYSGLLQPCPVDYQVYPDLYSSALTLIVDNMMFYMVAGTFAYRDLTDTTGNKAISYAVSGLPSDVVLQGYDKATNALIFYSAENTMLYISNPLSNMPALSVASTVNVTAVTAGQRTGFYIKSGDNVYVANATAITSGIFAITPNSYTNFTASNKWLAPGWNTTWLSTAANGATGLCPFTKFQFFSDKPYFVYTPFASFASATAVKAFAVNVTDLFSGSPVYPYIVSTAAAISGQNHYQNSMTYYNPVYNCYMAGYQSPPTLTGVTGAVGAISAGAPIGKVLLPTPVVKTNAFSMSVVYEVSVEYGQLTS